MVTDEKNHMNVTEVLEKGISRKVVVVMEEENLRNVEVLEKRNKRNVVVKDRTIRPVCTASDTSCFFRCEFKSLSKSSSDFKRFQGSFHLQWQWSCFRSIVLY